MWDICLICTYKIPIILVYLPGVHCSRPGLFTARHIKTLGAGEASGFAYLLVTQFGKA